MKQNIFSGLIFSLETGEVASSVVMQYTKQFELKLNEIFVKRVDRIGEALDQSMDGLEARGLQSGLESEPVAGVGSGKSWLQGHLGICLRLDCSLQSDHLDCGVSLGLFLSKIK